MSEQKPDQKRKRKNRKSAQSAESRPSSNATVSSSSVGFPVYGLPNSPSHFPDEANEENLSDRLAEVPLHRIRRCLESVRRKKKAVLREFPSLEEGFGYSTPIGPEEEMFAALEELEAKLKLQIALRGRRDPRRDRSLEGRNGTQIKPDSATLTARNVAAHSRCATIEKILNTSPKQPPHETICKKLDYFQIEPLERWVEDGIETWLDAYNNLEHRPRVQRIISGDIGKISKKRRDQSFQS